MVRNSYQGLGSEYESLLGAFDKDLATLKKRVDKDRASGTYKIQVRSRNYVASFLQACHRRTDISMQELTPDFIKEFAVYLSNDRGLASSTIWLTCMHLKGVVGHAHDNGKIQRNVFANNVTAQVIRDEKRNLFLHINETPIVQWFKEQFGLGQEQRRGIRV